LPFFSVTSAYGLPGTNVIAQGSSKSAITVTSNGCDALSVGAASLTDGWQAAAKKDAPIRNDNFDMYTCSSNIR
jgi:hypothetical protein